MLSARTERDSVPMLERPSLGTRDDDQIDGEACVLSFARSASRAPSLIPSLSSAEDFEEAESACDGVDSDCDGRSMRASTSRSPTCKTA
jgi:hypothetical protein